MASMPEERLSYTFSHSSFEIVLKKFLWLFSISSFINLNSSALPDKRGEIMSDKKISIVMNCFDNLCFMLKE